MLEVLRNLFAPYGIETGVISSVPTMRKYDFGFKPKSTAVAVFPYLVPRERGANLCRYAVVPDYHRVVGDYLRDAVEALEKFFPEQHFKAFVDASPLNEAWAAACAGLGVIGRNTLLITPKWGSYVFVGCIVTDLETAAPPAEPKRCVECNACEQACPGSALHSCKLDRAHCLSAVTQKKGELTAEETRLIRQNGLVWGCDVCQTVCPMNVGAAPTVLPEFTEGARQQLRPADLVGDLSDRAYLWRGKNVLRRNLEIFKDLW